MAKKIVWSELARDDRKNIFAYWKERNRSNSYNVKLNKRFSKAIKLIADHPQIGKSTSIENVRVKIVDPYLLVYEIFDTYISVVSIWDGRQNPTQLSQIINNP